MIIKERIALTTDIKADIERRITEAKAILDKKYPLLFIVSLVLIELLLFTGIYLTEDTYFWISLFLKLMMIVPIWIIISITLKYFVLRKECNRLNNLYRQLLDANSYEVLRVKSELCCQYNDGLHNYFLFETKTKDAL